MSNESKLAKIEDLLLKCETELEVLKEFNLKLPEIQSNIKELLEYYQNDYILDVEDKKNVSSDYRILDQDSIWNVISDYDIETKHLLKQIVNDL